MRTHGAQSHEHAARRQGGFTLLELVIAIGLLALLVGMIFNLATTNIGLANAVVEKQNSESVRMAFLELLEDQFASLPGNTRMELTYEDSGGQYLSDITLQNVPATFTWGGSERVAKAVRLSTVRRRDGFLDIVLSYYEDEILEETTEVGDTSSSQLSTEPFAEITLLEDIYVFEWRARDGTNMEWYYDWDIPGRLPVQLELSFRETPDDEIVRHVFWLPQKQDPAVMMRQLQNPTGQGGAGANGAGGSGGNPVEVNPNPSTGDSGQGSTPTITIPPGGGGGGR